MTFRASPSDGIAWVTGASSGIGRAVALELVRRGWRVAATARRTDELERLAEDARALGGAIVCFPGDVTDRDQMKALVARISEEEGEIALAFLNVGAFFEDRRGEWAGDAFRRTIDVNFTGTLNCLEPIMPRMVARGKGQIAVMASVAGYGGLPRAASYCASKAALISLCSSMRFELGRKGVGMQVVCPGFVRTPLTSRNDYPMPFVLDVEDAARRICDGFASRRFEIAFPRRMAWTLKLLNMLPYDWYFRLLGRGARA